MFRRATYLLGAIAAVSCSAVLGLDEPTHRQGVGAAGAGTGGEAGAAGMQAGGSSSQAGTGGAQAGGSNAPNGGGGQGGVGVSGSGGSSSPDGGGGSAGGAADGGKDVLVLGGCSVGLCDDFETFTAMGRPDPAKWKIESTIPTSKIGIDPAFFHSSSQSVAINSTGDALLFRNDTVALTLGPVVYVRFFVMMRQGSTGRGAFFVATDVSSRTFMFGVENNVLTHRLLANNTVLANLPSDPAATMSPMIPINAWQCMEIRFDRSGEIQTWVNGTEIAGLHADFVGTPGIDDTWNLVNWKPTLEVVAFGWQPYFMGQNNLNIDDVAVTNQRIGCN